MDAYAAHVHHIIIFFFRVVCLRAQVSMLFITVYNEYFSGKYTLAWATANI